MAEKRKIMGPLEGILLLGTLGVIGYVLFKQDGCQVVHRTESTEIIENPHAETNWQQNRRPYAVAPEDMAVEQVLSEIAKQFSVKQEISASPKFEQRGVDEDEVSFYQLIGKRYANKIDNAKNWYYVLEASRNTYQQVKSFFNEAGLPEEVNPDPQSIDQLLRDDQTAVQLFEFLEKKFQISPADARRFANQGQHALSDWAAFAEEQKK